MKTIYSFLLMILFVSSSFVLKANSDAKSFTGTAQESFDYTAGESLVGQTAPAEFSGEWTVSSAEWDGSAIIAAEGLTYPGLTTTGGALYLQTGSNEARLECNYNGEVCAPGTTIWASMLFKSDNDLDGSGQVWLQPSAATTAAQEESGFGYHWAANFKSVGNWDENFFGPEIMGGTTYLLLAKFVVAQDASMEASYWVDPVLDGNEPSAETAFFVTSFAEMFTSDHIALWAGYGESGITIDEIRVSDSYFDFGPEPFEGTALESFAYTSGEALVGQLPPAEFDGEWSLANAEWDGSAVIADGLSYEGMNSSGGAVYIQTGTNETRLECNYTGEVSTPGTTLWASMLFKSDNDLDGSGQVWLQPSAATTAAQEESGFGYHWAANFKSVGNWDENFFGPEIMGGTTYLLLAKFVVAEDASMEATYWVDPVLEVGVEPSVESAFFVTSFDEMFASDHIALWAGYGESGITIDEIRVSTVSYMDPLTSIQDRNDTRINFNLYPNPSLGIFNIELEDNTIETQVSIINLVGQTCYTSANVESNGVIDVSDLPSGIYMVELSNVNGKSIKKISIQ